ncbi:MAG TPA: DUF2975 domain-containing protein [Streptosporangiaceae bacterium]|nr:DUF2975 domain-containing protein [Streptosporangiaceae bacterium]
MITRSRKLTEPLESVAWFFLTLTGIAVLAVIGFTVFGSGSIFGIGRNADVDVCVTQPFATYSSSDWHVTNFDVHNRPGNSLQINGTLQACADHPSIGQHVLYALSELPATVLWVGVLLATWQLIAAARRDGPFTPKVATSMRRLGWFILVGTVVSALVHEFAADELLVSMARLPQPFVSMIFGPLRALVPVPALAGAALLTFARIIGLGTEMDEEIKGTV